MRVRINIGLDFDGNHTFEWSRSEADGAVDVPRTTLERWAAEREAFTVAYLRWKRVVEEIEETLYRAEQTRSDAAAAREREAVAVAVVGAHSGGRRR